MAIYKVTLKSGETFKFSANMVEASAPILLVYDDGEGGQIAASTPFQTADARHRPWNAARLLQEWGDDADDPVESVEVEGQ